MPQKENSERYLSLDYFRGFSVFLMILCNLVPLYSKNVPLFLQHGREDIFLFGDLGAPFFLFIMGVALGISVHRRTVWGETHEEIFKRVLRRTLLLFIIGLVLDATVFRTLLTWGVLETLAVSYFVSYILIRNRIQTQILFVLAMYAIYASLSSMENIIQFIRSAPHGGPLSFLSWAPITIFGVLCGDRLVKNKRDYNKFLLLTGASLMLLGYFLSFKIPFNKRIVSVSYSIFSSGASVILFLLFYHLVEMRNSKGAVKLFSPFRVFGINALIVWILQYPFGYWPVYYYVGHARFLSFSSGAMVTMAILFAIWFMGKILMDKDIVLKL